MYIKYNIYIKYHCTLSLGPGLAIRVICAEEPYICKDFPETNNILKIVADFSASVKKVICVEFVYYRSFKKIQLINTRN